MLMYGVVRLSGLLFVASMDRFQVDRQQASLPYILCDTLQAMAGPIAGFLGLRFGVRPVIMMGSLITAIGTGTCFFAENILTVTVLWGVVYGFGFGLGTLLLPVVITQHFLKKRATAISVLYVGSYVGFSILPTVTEFLIQTYGLSGTFLWLSAFILHGVPLAMLLRPPDFLLEENKDQEVLSIKNTISRNTSAGSGFNSYHRTSSKRSTIGGMSQDFQCKDNELNTINEDVESEFFSEGHGKRKSVAKDTNHGENNFNSNESTNISTMETSDTSKQLNTGIDNVCFVAADIMEHHVKESPLNPLKVSNLEKHNHLHSEESAELNNIATDSPCTTVQSGHGIENKGFISDELSECDFNEVPNVSKCPISENNRRFNSLCNSEYMEESLKTLDHKIEDDRDRRPSNRNPVVGLRYIPNNSSQVNLNPSKIGGCMGSIPFHRTQSYEKCPEDTYWVSTKSGSIASGKERRMSILLKSSELQGAITTRLSKKNLSLCDALKIFIEPIYLLVLFSEAVYCFSFISFITVIIDFTKDIGLPESDGKYIIMAFSIASNVGLLSFGWVTDDGYLSLTNFSGFMFLSRTITLFILPYCNGFALLMVAVAIQGFCESSLANMFPLIVAEYFTEDVHELAISCTLFLCGPMYLTAPPLVGYFRDGLGSYVYLFFLMGSMSLISSIMLFLAPLLAKCRCGRDDWILRKTNT
ncbi:uncharacterized protein NPIL_486071 [Nephila pilipes]|uniref:Major facilitator superfamily (MFS) profile domain-containing protein n=1 Tax=Nephila pilipes TaxID=299642 RepID=A0A8X6MKR3_NEPPI|nr:uncharacterized protein NPIL_486071 [Nephila pilipes]